MKVILVLVLALAAIVLAVQGEKVTIEGCLVRLSNLIRRKTVKIEIEDTETIKELGIKICEKLEKKRPVNVRVLDTTHWFGQGNLSTSLKIKDSGLKDGSLVIANCHPPISE